MGREKGLMVQVDDIKAKYKASYKMERNRGMVVMGNNGAVATG